MDELDVALPVVQNQGWVEFHIDEDVHIPPSEWSHIATTLLTSEDTSLIFDVRKYANADEAIMRLLPDIKMSSVLMCVYICVFIYIYIYTQSSSYRF